MVTDTGIIVVSIISIFGMMTFMFLSQYNYFKKKTFLHRLGQQKKIDKLKLSQLRKELGVKDQPAKQIDQTDQLNSIIGNIADRYMNKEEDEEEEDDITSFILSQAKEHPELTKSILGNLGSLAGNKKTDEIEQRYLGQD